MKVKFDLSKRKVRIFYWRSGCGLLRDFYYKYFENVIYFRYNYIKMVLLSLLNYIIALIIIEKEFKNAAKKYEKT
jgi:hypothetical protein